MRVVRRLVAMLAVGLVVGLAGCGPCESAGGPARAEPRPWSVFCDGVAPPAPPVGRFDIVGPISVKAYRLVRLEAINVPAGAHLLWDVFPDEKADVIEDGNRLAFVGPPGTYTVRARALVVAKDKSATLSARVTVTIEGPPGPPAPPAPPPGPSRPDPIKATAKVVFPGGGYCTITPIYPRRADGAWDMVCAAHCTGGVGSKAVAEFADGRKVPVVCTVSVGDRSGGSPDAAWYVTEAKNLADLPYAVLASSVPPVGTPVWQNGNGVTTKRQVRHGKLATGVVSGGMLAFDLVVSKGDSGGGIFNESTGELLATVCCTQTNRPYVYGAACTLLGSYRPAVGHDVPQLGVGQVVPMQAPGGPQQAPQQAPASQGTLHVTAGLAGAGGAFLVALVAQLLRMLADRIERRGQARQGQQDQV